MMQDAVQKFFVLIQKCFKIFFNLIKTLVKSFALVFLTLIVIVFFSFSRNSESPSVIGKRLPDSMVLTLSLGGDVSDHDGSASFFRRLSQGALSHFEVLSTLDQAKNDNRIKGLLLNVKAGGMGLAKSHELLEALRQFRKAGKFVVAYSDTFGDMGNATGQYFLALGADEIMMQPYGSLNLLGIGIDLPHGKKFLDALKITPQFYKRDEYKSALDAFTEGKITPANQEALTTLLGSLFDTIIKEISKERDLSEQDVRALIEQAPIHTATKALKLGLIDRVFYYDQCVAYCLKKAGEGSVKYALANYSHHMGESFQSFFEGPQVSSDAKESPSNTSIALLFGEGEVTRYDAYDPMDFQRSSALSSGNITKSVEDILKNDKIKALVFRLNTPGGSPVASETIWRQLQRLKKKGIKVVVSMGDYCASGGYWIASGAHKIVANPMTVTGSIGAIGGKFSIAHLLKALDIQVDSIRFGDQSLSSSPFHDFSTQEWKSHKEAIDIIYNAFIHKVAEGRKMDPSHVLSLAKGRPWSGEDALRLGLVDTLGDLHTAFKIAKELAQIPPKETPEVIIYPRHQGVLDFIKNQIIHEDMGEETQESHLYVLQKIILLYNKILSFIKTSDTVQLRSDIHIH
jgi:protease-4